MGCQHQTLEETLVALRLAKLNVSGRQRLVARETRHSANRPQEVDPGAEAPGRERMARPEVVTFERSPYTRSGDATYPAGRTAAPT